MPGSIESSLIQYRAAVKQNCEVFLVNHTIDFTTFSRIDRSFDELLHLIHGRRTAEGKSQFSLLPMLMLMQRQARVAFDAMSTCQSYQAWVMLRVALEAALVVGKWFDDSKNVEIWKNRVEDPGAYQHAFSGRKLCSSSLHRSSDLQRVLRRVNDLYVHPNPDYCLRHLRSLSVGQDERVLALHYFDSESELEAHVVSFLHLLIIIQDSIAKLLMSLFQDLQVDVGLESFESVYAERAQVAAAQSVPIQALLTELGLWKLPEAR